MTSINQPEYKQGNAEVDKKFLKLCLENNISHIARIYQNISGMTYNDSLMYLQDLLAKNIEERRKEK